MNNFNVPDWEHNKRGDKVSKDVESVEKLRRKNKSPKTKKASPKTKAKDINKNVATVSKNIKKAKSPNTIRVQSSPVCPPVRTPVATRNVTRKKIVNSPPAGDGSPNKKQKKVQNVTTNGNASNSPGESLKSTPKPTSKGRTRKRKTTAINLTNGGTPKNIAPVSVNVGPKITINSPPQEVQREQTPKKSNKTTGRAKRGAKQKQSPQKDAINGGKNVVTTKSKKKPSPAPPQKKTSPMQLASSTGAINKKKPIKKGKIKIAGLLATKKKTTANAIQGGSAIATVDQVSTKKKKSPLKSPRTTTKSIKTSDDKVKGTANKVIVRPHRDRNEKKLTDKLVQVLSTSTASFGPRKISLNARMKNQLKSARFRYINEELYTKDSNEAMRLFKDDPEAYHAYHEGYRQQVQKWPLNPLSKIITSIQKMPENLVVADFGCGDAELANSIKQSVHSFDLVASNDRVTACDMAKVPLENGSVDVAVFCLSLMGTNLQDYILEANRILKVGGLLKIAEVESRFDKVDTFIAGVNRFGFDNIHKDFTHNLFYFMDFRKRRDIRKKKNLPTMSLLPCMYKKR